jgi:hypothetical protein
MVPGRIQTMILKAWVEEAKKKSKTGDQATIDLGKVAEEALKNENLTQNEVDEIIEWIAKILESWYERLN